MMEYKNSASDPSKKYWLLLLVVVPIIIALIGILPTFFKSKPSSSSIQERENIQKIVVTGSKNKVQIGDNNVQK